VLDPLAISNTLPRGTLLSFFSGVSPILFFSISYDLVVRAKNAIRMLEAGLATREDIDTAVKLGTNMPYEKESGD
jgi:hypothetical protein